LVADRRAPAKSRRDGASLINTWNRLAIGFRHTVGAQGGVIAF
jgi:hypothetical protein